MTQSKKVIISDYSTMRVVITGIDHNPSDDLEIAVADKCDEIGLDFHNSEWMELLPDFKGVEIID